jgi:ABC-type phosphate/phosphonate transport system substrate-binding protein
MQILMRPFKSLMEEQTGVYGVLVNAGDQDELGPQIMDDKLQLGVFHGFEFAWARLKFPELRPLLIAVNQENYLRSLLIVREDNSAQSVADLKNKILTVPRLNREHCRLYLERRCTLPGVATEKHYAQIVSAGDIEEALDLVVDGKAAAAVVDQVEMEGYRKNKPGRSAKLKILVQSEPFPCATLAYNPAALPKSLVGRFREGMAAAKNTRKGQQMLQLCRITGFEAVPDDYEQMLVHIAKAYPPPDAK